MSRAEQPSPGYKLENLGLSWCVCGGGGGARGRIAGISKKQQTNPKTGYVFSYKYIPCNIQDILIVFVLYVKFVFNWVFRILSGNPGGTDNPPNPPLLPIDPCWPPTPNDIRCPQLCFPNLVHAGRQGGLTGPDTPPRKAGLSRQARLWGPRARLGLTSSLFQVQATWPSPASGSSLAPLAGLPPGHHCPQVGRLPLLQEKKRNPQRSLRKRKGQLVGRFEGSRARPGAENEEHWPGRAHLEKVIASTGTRGKRIQAQRGFPACAPRLSCEGRCGGRGAASRAQAPPPAPAPAAALLASLCHAPGRCGSVSPAAALHWAAGDTWNRARRAPPPRPLRRQCPDPTAASACPQRWGLTQGPGKPSIFPVRPGPVGPPSG